MGNKTDSLRLVDDLGPPYAEEPDLLADLVCTNSVLRRAARQLGHLYDEALAPLGLKATQVGLIAEIGKLSAAAADKREEGPTLQDLAARLAIQISALTHALRPLVRDGLVELRQDTQDRRTKHAVLAPLGQQRLHEALVLWAAANQRVEDVLGASSAEMLRGLAERVASDEFAVAYRGGPGRP
ncbi:MarR family transcriptional regulator [Paraburkholderia sp. BL8N3]|nr:MarR family transcriptional regulator [Paraburkholderia sp. BL8N3]TCK39141.1 MarR family transcriptional regulator [Paraburkholderia sp. BL8N3]